MCEPHPQHPASADAGGAPFGLPVLAEVPELAGVLQLATDVERLHRRLIAGLLELRTSGLAEAATGVALEQWLATVVGLTGSDRRMLVTTADRLARLPNLARTYAEGGLSWSQLRAIVCKICKLPRELDAKLDSGLVGLVEATTGLEPDELARQVGWLLDELRREHETDPDDGGAREPWLLLQPRLDGTGGKVIGDLDAVGFAAVDTVTAPRTADLTGTGPARDLLGQSADPDPGRAGRGRVSQLRAAYLTDLALRAATGAPLSADDARPGAAGNGMRLLARVELGTLLGGGLPAQLLTTLAGGRMQVDADTARQLTDRLGANLRLVVVDRGRVVGVGRTTSEPPGWLADAIAAVYDTCTEPGCDVAVRICDSDHATRWADGGRTDADNLAPLCATTNRGIDRDRWEITQQPDGTRTWHHPRTGLTTRTVPATWRPHHTDPAVPGTGCVCGGCTCRAPARGGAAGATLSSEPRAAYEAGPSGPRGTVRTVPDRVRHRRAHASCASPIRDGPPRRAGSPELRPVPRTA
jgi:hypothetical protein